MRHGEGEDSAHLPVAKAHTNKRGRVPAPTATPQRSAETPLPVSAPSLNTHTTPHRRKMLVLFLPPALLGFWQDSILLPHLLGHKGKDRTPQPRDTYVNDDTFVEQALLLGSHDEIVGAVLVVNNVLQINPCREKYVWTQFESLSAHYMPRALLCCITGAIVSLHTLMLGKFLKHTRLGKRKRSARIYLTPHS